MLPPAVRSPIAAAAVRPPPNTKPGAFIGDKYRIESKNSGIEKFGAGRTLWGSDWPHPTQKDDDKPNDAILADLLAEWAPDEAVRNRILVDNPATIYGFGKSS